MIYASSPFLVLIGHKLIPTASLLIVDPASQCLCSSPLQVEVLTSALHVEVNASLSLRNLLNTIAQCMDTARACTCGCTLDLLNLIAALYPSVDCILATRVKSQNEARLVIATLKPSDSKCILYHV